MLNKAILMGRLTRDPELRHTQSNIAVATFPIAVERDYRRNDSGQREVDFIDIVTWRNTAEFVSKWFRKGQQVVISGRIQTRTWQDRDGNNRRTVEVVADDCYFADSKRDNVTSAPMEAPAPMDEHIFASAQSDFSPAAINSDFEELIGEDTELPF